MRTALASLLLALAAGAAKKSSSSYKLLDLADDTLLPAAAEHKLLLVAVGVSDCQPCRQVERVMEKAGAELRVKAPDAGVRLAKLTILSQDSPTIGNIVQGQLTIPKVLLFRDGEALDFNGELSKAGIVAEMLRQVSRETILTLKSVKQAERFLHLDTWSATHDEEKASRVVGFFPSNATAGYEVFASTARKLQGMIAFGACFDPALQKKFLGAPAKKSIVQVVKAEKRERKLTYEGPLAVPRLARWVATHSLALVQDLTTESSIEAHMARGVPVFLLLMPDECGDGRSDSPARRSVDRMRAESLLDSRPLVTRVRYEESLSTTITAFRTVAARVRDRLLFAYGFKDTEPWPQFAQSLGIDRGATGAYWMIVGNNMELTGRNWSTAWLKPPSLGFQIYSMEARGGESAEDVTEVKLSKFVDKFLRQVDEMLPPENTLIIITELLIIIRSMRCCHPRRWRACSRRRSSPTRRRPRPRGARPAPRSREAAAAAAAAAVRRRRRTTTRSCAT